MNTKVVLLVIGLLVGGVAGWTTAPKLVDVKLGPLSVQVQGDNGSGNSIVATGSDGQIKVQVGSQSPLDDRDTRTLIFAIVGGLIGLGLGFAVDRRRSV
jgi:hypothetical protein